MDGPDEVELLRWVVETEWLELDALIREKRPEMLADVVFLTRAGQVYLTSKAHCLSDDTEAFSLNFGCYPEAGRSNLGSGPSFLTTRDIKKELVANSLGQLLAIPRTVRFFTDQRFATRVYPKIVGVLDNCAGIEFSKVVDGAISRLVLVASINFPCEIEMGIDPAACALLLQGLEQIDLLTF